MAEQSSHPRIAVVGPCGSGKSTLARQLRALGYRVREPAQEHSGVPDMWQRMTAPDVLIYLDAELPTIAQRRNIRWGQDYLDELNRRLRHARRHASFYLPTDGLTPVQVL
ncbi:MAG: AAA family ATPase, partial [Anaerolineae bacterium]